jgi:hypothetical protein
MPLPLPNLDDRRWLDLTQEAIPLIPRYAPQWTDFNASDPGITIMEMFAWLTESLVYRLNQVPDRFRWKFLAMLGYPARGPVAAFTALSFQPIPPGTPFEMPAGVQFNVGGTSGGMLFATTRAIDLAKVTLTALQCDPGTGVLSDASRDFSDHLPITALGVDPVPGAAVYFGFDAIPAGSPVALWLSFDGSGHGADVRQRLIAEAAEQKAACQVVSPGWACNQATSKAFRPCSFESLPVPPHHSARIVWECFAGGAWSALTAVAMPARPAVGQVVDDTRSLTLDGLVEVNLPVSITQTTLGALATPLYYLRARLASGAYDAPVVLDSVLCNAVNAVQRVPLWQTLSIAGNLGPLPTPPTPGTNVSLQFTLAPDLTVQVLTVQSPPAANQPSFEFLNYVAPGGGTAGSFTLEFVIAGIGTAVPSQPLYIPGAPVVDHCLRLFTHDGKSWEEWSRVADFDAARRIDRSFTLDPTTGLVVCGDGERGQTFPQGGAIVVTGFTTLGDGGNLLPAQSWTVPLTPVNAVLLGAVSAADHAVLAATVANPGVAAGGLAAVALTQLEGEAAEVIAAHERILDLAEAAQQTTLDQIPHDEVLALPAPTQAVTLLDAERIALDVPGTALARARAWPDTDPLLPGIHATGVVTVVIMPAMPVAEPTPSAGLLAAVKRYLDRRRVLCTRLAVVAPTYVVITVNATVQALTGASAASIASSVQAALDGFLNPTTGGPAGLGWPFGRHVYQAEILQLIAAVPGVDYVISLELTAGSGTPQCGDIPICPNVLVSSGTHNIQVVTMS